MRFISISLIISLVIQPLLLAEVEVSARFNPPRIALGDSSQYIVEITERSTDRRPEVERIDALPIPDGHELRLSNGRTSSGQRTRIINGTAEYSVTQSLLIDANAPRAGTFTLPGYTLNYRGENLRIPAATLEVVERTADAGPTRDELVFLEAELPDQIFIGQTISLELKLFLEESVQLSGLNSFDRSANGFTISELPDDFREDVELANGRRYRTLTWRLSLTPIQTGAQEISFQFGLTARLPGQNSRNNLRQSPFGSSLFDDFFGRSERINVFTEPREIEVLPLPEADQPQSFTGAIGKMALEVASDGESCLEGEPILFSVVLKGSGNFERINEPGFPETTEWKNYSPERNFESDDPLGLRGELRFDYVFIPQKAGRLQLPETRFSYFDPELKEYVELVAPPIPIDVEAAERRFSEPARLPPPVAEDGSLPLSRALTAEEALLTLNYRPEPARAPDFAILESPFFLAANLSAALLLAGISNWLHRQRRNREDPTFRLCAEARKQLKLLEKDYRRALASGNAEAFYQHAQSALRHKATIRVRRSMQNADAHEIAAQLPDDLHEICLTFFKEADAHRFGGNSKQPLERSSGQLERILNAL